MHTTQLQFKYNIFNSAFLAILLALSTSYASAQTLPPNCRALTNIKDDLWLVKADGAPVQQLTHDGRRKEVIGGVSPDGKMIAYMEEEIPDDFTHDKLVLIDVNGKLLSKTFLDTAAFVVGLSWVNPNLLRVKEHDSPTVSAYQFVQVPAGGAHPVLSQGLPIKGLSCTASPDARDMACVADADWVSISLNDRQDIYVTTDSFESAVELQTLDIAVGSAVTTATVPPFKLEVTEIIKNQYGITGTAIGMKITTPDDLLRGLPMPTVYIPSGVTWDESVASDSDEIPPTLYGVAPTIKHEDHERGDREKDASEDKEHRKPAIVTVRVVKSVTGPYSLQETELVWSPNGRRLAAVETNDLGQRFLVLINPYVRDEEEDAREGERREYKRNNIDARELLPIDGPIQRIEFTSDSHIRVVGATQAFEQDIPSSGKVRDTTNYTITPASAALPKLMAVPDGLPFVYGWVCP